MGKCCPSKIILNFNYDHILGRKQGLFDLDLSTCRQDLLEIVESSSFLIIGGAGSIGQAVVKEIFKRNPLKLHVIDISENNLTELVRDIRSSFGYISGDFQVFTLDIGSDLYKSFIKSQGKYNYVINLSALKHVRSEKDPFTLMRMIEVNIQNTISSLQLSIDTNADKYFSVSTDKAANPVNMMGASKRIMEKFLIRKSNEIQISSARFANVAFSDGSLLYSFLNRFSKRQPIVAPNDIKRYFITPKESGELCLMSCLLGKNREVFFPKLTASLPPTSFNDLACKYLNSMGYTPYECSSEDEARSKIDELLDKKMWPCFFSPSDTTGEKPIEEFFTAHETVCEDSYKTIGILKQNHQIDDKKLNDFLISLKEIKDRGTWTKSDLVTIFKNCLAEFKYEDIGKYLDTKM